MKYAIIASVLLLSACSSPSITDLEKHLRAEEDFHSHQVYIEELYTKYDPEFVDDCIFYKLECGF